MKFTTKRLVLCALFTALSAVGANIKIFGTIAFDSMPAFAGSLIFGVMEGSIIGFLGHMMTALTSGFPYGVLVHIIIAFSMIITVSLYCFAFRKICRLGVSIFVSAVLATLISASINGPVTLLVLIPILGSTTFFLMVIPLFLVSIANSILAQIIYQMLITAKIIPEKVQ